MAGSNPRSDLRAGADWNPETYGRFRGFRLRPALDLLTRVGDLPPGDVVDLGCGAGAVGAALRSRWPDRRIVGVDSSPAMRAEGRATGAYDAIFETDIAQWQPQTPPALIFSNAALHWLPDHDQLMPQLARRLAPGGVLAVQMPRQYGAPSHRFLRDIAAAMFPDRFQHEDAPPVSSAQAYWASLSPLGAVDAWETDYLQHLGPADGAHPVRRFTESTAMRPFLAKLSPSEAETFAAAYDAALSAAYPLLPDGGTLLPFRRCFFVLTGRV
ncbi:trans-aconitate 2-methyltransferase [Cereibacter ovatus]|uniref:Trans-aconitate 2-methyltransferase n=1 Tax=Cereibacter ovatus TaxID=439529 RepID=A0A285CML1_9RHOB|nr:methyltransferase domain-containing protein [Cereibacter ovatus]SNX68800.1 trans-aconitate 2-methyltransferase [Cereibacter ovatus]